MAFCINCGTQLSEAAKFCSECGGPVGTAATTPVNAPARKSNSLLTILRSVAAVLIFLGCVGVGAAYYFLHRVEAKIADSTQGLPDVNAITKAFPMMPYQGVGDEAWINLGNVVTARKGDRGITMDLRYYHDSDDLTKMLTNTALARLQDKKQISLPSLVRQVPETKN